MRLGTLGDHLSSANHKSSVQVEHTQHVSHIHKVAVQKDAEQDVILQNAFLSPYWLAKEEVANKKFPSLLTLLEHTRNNTITFFMHKSQQSIMEIFQAKGDELCDCTIREHLQILISNLVSDVNISMFRSRYLLCATQEFRFKTQLNRKSIG